MPSSGCSWISELSGNYVVGGGRAGAGHRRRRGILIDHGKDVGSGVRWIRSQLNAHAPCAGGAKPQVEIRLAALQPRARGDGPFMTKRQNFPSGATGDITAAYTACLRAAVRAACVPIHVRLRQRPQKPARGGGIRRTELISRRGHYAARDDQAIDLQRAI